MILLKKFIINDICDLQDTLQLAIELEHATIPPYLTANFTLHNADNNPDPGTNNSEIINLVGSVVGEEMLHMSIVCNILNAIGGHPNINKADFVPNYPCALPGSVESGLLVSLEKFSKALVQNVFMVIEEPEHPMNIQLSALASANVPVTIGMFYNIIAQRLTTLETQERKSGHTIFTGDVSLQMTNENWFPSSVLFPITSLETALAGIDIIVDQGEGSSNDPFVNGKDEQGNPIDPAHYYRFQEIVKGKHLKVDPHAEAGFSFSGPAIPFCDDKIANMWPNSKMSDYPVDSLAYLNSKMFNYTYTSLLNCLHITFNGKPENINTAMGLMYSLRLNAFKLLQTPDPNPNHPGYVAGPSFEFVPADSLSLSELEQVHSHA